MNQPFTYEYQTAHTTATATHPALTAPTPLSRSDTLALECQQPGGVLSTAAHRW